MNRREIILGGASAAAVLSATGLHAQQAAEVLIGAVYQMSGASAQVGVDAQHAFDTALDVINNVHDLDLPLAKGAGLPGLDGAKMRVIVADHQGDPQKGRAEAERLITREKVAALIGSYQSAVAVTISQTAERYQVPVPLRGQLLAKSQSSGPEVLFPPRALMTRCSRRRCSISSTP